MRPLRLTPATLLLCAAASNALYAQTPTADTATMDTVTVTAQAPGYAAPEAATGALKTDVPLLETPQAITVIERQIIEDQGARKMEDVLKNVAGVTPGGYFQDWDYYRIRGFESSYSTSYIDGLLTDGSPGEELWGAERVEIIKGPASTLYGGGPLGGFVNTVTKRPYREFGGKARFTGGAWDFYEGAIDINMPLLSQETSPPAPTSAKGSKDVIPLAQSAGLGIYARLNALYKNSGSFVDYVESERLYIAPSILFQFGENTSLTLLASYKNDQIDLAYGLPARGTVLSSPYGEIPVSRYVGNPNLGNNEWERTIRLGYEFKHQFNDHLTLRQNFRYHWLDWTSKHLSYPQSLEGRLLGLSGYYATGNYQGLRIDTAMDARFATGALQHTLTVGTDYRWTETAYSARDSVDLIFLDVFRPNYGSLPDYVYGPTYGSTEQDADLGFYIQDHIKIGDKLSLTLGGRVDFSSYDSGTGEYTEDAFTPKVGLTYEFIPGVAAYANYSRSFNPQWYSTDSSGSPVKPEEGENWETGVKYSLLDGKVTGLLAVYQLTRENVATANLATTDPFDSIITGEQRSRGFEFETAAELAPGLNLSVAYTYIDAEITQDNDYEVGTRLQGVPDHAINAWLKYTLQDGPLKGFGVGIGGRYYTSQGGDISDSFSLPAYGIVDAALYYERDDFSVQVNFNNVLDKRHFVGSYDDVYVLAGPPFNVTASVSWKF